MSAAVRTWLVIGLSLGYLVAVHLAFLRRSPWVAATAVALLVLLALASIKGPHRFAWRAFAAVPGVAIVVLTARGAPPVLLLLPPVAISALVGFGFGRTLLPGRKPLIERLARGFHAPQVPPPELITYTRCVTWAWTLLMVFLTLTNAVLVANLSPGGLLELAGLAPPWPVSPEFFVWFSNTGTYLLIGGMFVVEFAVRVWRFPDYRFRNPLQFVREARTRMPNIMAAMRD
jgi:uncharacterized membrane protein